MITEKFSAAAFESKGLDTDAASALAAELEDVVARILDQALRPVLATVVRDLNRLGHNLKQNGARAIGEIGYRDERTDEQGESARLRLAVDIVVSAGYAHNRTGEEVLAELKARNRQRRSRKLRKSNRA